MKYRTMIELVCEASDKDDACHVAGEYLRGTVDSGVKMKFKTRLLQTHRAFKCGIVSFAVLFCFAALLFSVIEPGKDGQVSDSKFRIPESCTVQPELKTNTVDKFRRAWETKQNEAMLE